MHNASDLALLVYPVVVVLMAWCHHVDPSRKRRRVFIPQPCPMCGWEACQCPRDARRRHETYTLAERPRVRDVVRQWLKGDR